MTEQPVRWVSVFLDVPAEVVDLAVGFWTAVTDSSLGDAMGEQSEFLPFDPAPGDPCLWVQRLQDGPVATHPDLYVDDVDAVAGEAVDLGASVVARSDGLVVLSSPGGLPFCLVRYRGQSRRPEPVGQHGSQSLVDQICIDIPPDRFDSECTFWAALTGWDLTDGEVQDEFRRLVRPPGIPYAFLLQRLDDDQPRVTAHVDISCEDRDGETARHEGLGARSVRRTDGWTVMRDPAGVTYCNTGKDPGSV
jgi:Glyoxalase-like domain